MNCDIELKCYSRQKKELLRELKKLFKISSNF